MPQLLLTVVIAVTVHEIAELLAVGNGVWVARAPSPPAGPDAGVNRPDASAPRTTCPRQDLQLSRV